MMHVLVTGAGGFVCSNIVDALLDSGAAVTAVDLGFSDSLRARWADRAVTLLESDVEHIPNFPADYFVHGAAVTADPEQRGETPEANFRANLDSLLAALEWVQCQGVRRAVFISSAAVFRGVLADSLTEETPTAPMGMYPVAKQTMEHLVRTLRLQYGRDLVSVRLSNVYGPLERRSETRPRVSLVGRMIDDALTNRKIDASHRSWLADWTFAPDIGRALALLLEAPTLRHDLYHVTSRQVFTSLEIACAIQAIIPDTEIINEAVDNASLYLAGDRFAAKTGFTDWTDFSTGLRRTIDWHRMEQSS